MGMPGPYSNTTPAHPAWDSASTIVFRGLRAGPVQYNHPNWRTLSKPCLQVGNFVYENFGLLTVPGNSAPSVRPPVNLIFADSSFTVVNGTAVANQYSTSTPAATATAPAPAPAPSAALRPVVAFAGRHL